MVGGFSASTIELGPLGELVNPDNDQDAFVLKFASDLTLQAGARFAEFVGASEQSALKVSSAAGSIYVGGVSSGPFDTGGPVLANGCLSGCSWLLRLNSDLVAIWAAGARGNATWADLSASDQGAVSLFSLIGNVELQPGSGMPQSFDASVGEAIVWRLNQAGNSVWTFKLTHGGPIDLGNLNYVGTRLDTVQLQDTASGPVLVAGVRGTVPLGDETFATDGSSDVALVKLDLTGGLEYVRHFPGTGDQGAAVLASQFHEGRLWAVLLNSGTVDLGFGPLVSDPSESARLVLTKLVP